ncbi:MAG: GDSL-type esterase/lipase family protein [Clostridia bacterium]|nr:GDSL-type esterase/lipase family protein [Clostridia bacterium]
MKITEKLKRKQDSMFGTAPVTIAFLGDSVTQGCFECYKKTSDAIETVFDYSRAYSSRLREMLNTLYPNVQINIINSGLSGDSAHRGYERFDRDITPYSPDLVIVGYALNDACCGERYIGRYRDAIRGILKKVGDIGAECILLTPNMMATHTSCHLTDKTMTDLSEKFASVQNGGVLDAYVAAEKEIATELGIKICDVYSRWMAMANSGVDITEMLANKLNHPIRQLHYMTAYLLCECIMGL